MQQVASIEKQGSGGDGEQGETSRGLNSDKITTRDKVKDIIERHLQ